jgi:hypothetical protein
MNEPLLLELGSTPRDSPKGVLNRLTLLPKLLLVFQKCRLIGHNILELIGRQLDHTLASKADGRTDVKRLPV